MQQTKTENYKFFIKFFYARPEVKNSTSARPKRFGRVFRPEVNIKQLKNAHKWSFNENNSTRSGALDLDQKWRGNTSPPPLRGELLGDFRHDRREGGAPIQWIWGPPTTYPLSLSLSISLSLSCSKSFLSICLSMSLCCSK